MKRVKGSILAGWVKSIRADKQTDFSQWLRDEDREIVSGTVLSSSWYPFETYQRCCRAVFQLHARGDPEVLSGWGAANAEAILRSTYPNHIIDGEPVRSLQKHLSVVRLFFDFGSISCEVLSENRVQVAAEGFPPDFEEICHLLRGWYGRILEMAGAAGVQSRFVSMAPKGDPVTRVVYWW